MHDPKVNSSKPSSSKLPGNITIDELQFLQDENAISEQDHADEDTPIEHEKKGDTKVKSKLTSTGKIVRGFIKTNTKHIHQHSHKNISGNFKYIQEAVKEFFKEKKMSFQQDLDNIDETKEDAEQETKQDVNEEKPNVFDIKKNPNVNQIKYLLVYGYYKCKDCQEKMFEMLKDFDILKKHYQDFVTNFEMYINKAKQHETNENQKKN